jgi:hypothetical protein
LTSIYGESGGQVTHQSSTSARNQYGVSIQNGCKIGSTVSVPVPRTIITGVGKSTGSGNGGVWIYATFGAAGATSVRGGVIDITGSYTADMTDTCDGVRLDTYVTIMTNGDGNGGVSSDPLTFNNHVHITGVGGSGTGDTSGENCNGAGVVSNNPLTIVHHSNQPGEASGIVIDGTAGDCPFQGQAGVIIQASLTCEGCDIIIRGNSLGGIKAVGTSLAGTYQTNGSLSVTGNCSASSAPDYSTGVALKGYQSKWLASQISITGYSASGAGQANNGIVYSAYDGLIKSNGNIDFYAVGGPGADFDLSIQSDSVMLANNNITVNGSTGSFTYSSNPLAAWTNFTAGGMILFSGPYGADTYPFFGFGGNGNGLLAQSGPLGIFIGGIIGAAAPETNVPLYVKLQPTSPYPVYMHTSATPMIVGSIFDVTIGGPLHLLGKNSEIRSTNGSVWFKESVDYESSATDTVYDFNVFAEKNITADKTLWIAGAKPLNVMLIAAKCSLLNPLAITAKADTMAFECPQVFLRGGVQGLSVSQTSQVVHIWPTAGSTDTGIGACGGMDRCTVIFEDCAGQSFTSGIDTSSKPDLDLKFGGLIGECTFTGALTLASGTVLWTRLDNTNASLPHDDWHFTTSVTVTGGNLSIALTSYNILPTQSLPIAIVNADSSVSGQFIQGVQADPIVVDSTNVVFTIVYHATYVELNYVSGGSSTVCHGILPRAC